MAGVAIAQIAREQDALEISGPQNVGIARSDPRWMLWICVAKLTVSLDVPSVSVGLWHTTHSCVLPRLPPCTMPRFWWQSLQLASETTWRLATIGLLSTEK